MDGDGFGELVIAADRGGPAAVKVWSGITLLGTPGPAAVAPVASFYAFPPNDPSGARVAVRDTDGDGLGELIVGSGNPRNSQARVFSYAQAVAGGAGGPVSYPLGTPNSFDGVYAGLHTDTTSQTPTNNDQLTAALPQGPGQEIFTATAAPYLHHCTCPACRVLAALAHSGNNQEPLVSTIPVS
jgi:hypothetical protein